MTRGCKNGISYFVITLILAALTGVVRHVAMGAAVCIPLLSCFFKE